MTLNINFGLGLNLSLKIDNYMVDSICLSEFYLYIDKIEKI